MWITYLNLKSKEHTKIDWGIAQVTKTLIESKGGKVKPLSDYLIKFKTEEEIDKEQEIMEDKIFSRMRARYEASLKNKQ